MMPKRMLGIKAVFGIDGRRIRSVINPTSILQKAAVELARFQKNAPINGGNNTTKINVPTRPS